MSIFRKTIAGTLSTHCPGFQHVPEGCEQEITRDTIYKVREGLRKCSWTGRLCQEEGCRGRGVARCGWEGAWRTPACPSLLPPSTPSCMQLKTTTTHHLTPDGRASPTRQVTQVLERLWRKRTPHSLLVGKQTGAATVENSVAAPQKTRNRAFT